MREKERGFETRRSTYEDTLTEVANEMWHARSVIEKIAAGNRTIDPRDDSDVRPELVGEWSRTRGRLASIAAESVMTVWEEYAQAATAFWTLVVEATTSRDTSATGHTVPPEKADELRPLRQTLGDKQEQLERRIREDLRGAST